MLAEPPTLPTATIDGKYRLEAPLGEGAYGTVYRALHLGLKKSFAVKLLRGSFAGDPELMARFQREAEALGRLRHPAIVEVTDYGVESENGPPYLVMELLEGEPLSERLRAEGALPLERALPILEAIAGGIDAAHAQGVLHRDLKPGNILLGTSGHPLVKVFDFGLAELVLGGGIEGAAHGHTATASPPSSTVSTFSTFSDDARLTATGALLGTPLYIAPELIEGPHASRASDLYSFAVIAYEMLAGTPPFTGSTGEVLAAHLRAAPPPPANLGSGLPEGAWTALRAGLDKDPKVRPASAGALVEDLRAAQRAASVRAWTRRETPRRLTLAALLALPVALAGGLLPNPSWSLLEALAFDTSLRFAASSVPDPRIVLVTLDSPEVPASAQPLGGRGPEIAKVAEAVYDAGARGISFDVLGPALWSQVGPLQQLMIRHAETLTLVAASRADGTVDGGSIVSPLTLEWMGNDRARSMFGFINVPIGAWGVARQGRTAFRTQEGILPSWAARSAALLTGRPPSLPGNLPPSAGDAAWQAFTTYWIDFRIDSRRYLKVPLEYAAAMASTRPEMFRGKLVILGGDPLSSIDDSKKVPTPAGRDENFAGIFLQALQVDTLARGSSVRPLAAGPLFLAAALLAFPLAAMLLLRRRLWAPLTVAAATAFLAIALGIVLFRERGILVPWTPVAAFLISGALLPWGLRRFLSRVSQP